jgi:hypothetical protein
MNTMPKPHQTAELDPVVTGLIETEPNLVAKLLCIDGLRGYVSGSAATDMTGLTPDQRAKRDEWRANQQEIRAVEYALIEQLQAHEDGRRIMANAAFWRDGFPPHAQDFSDAERAIVHEYAGLGGFLGLAAEHLPTNVADTTGVTS